MADSFAAAVAAWGEKCEVRKTAVQHQALRLLDAEIAGNTPVVTGNLKNSRAVSTLGPVSIEWKTKKFRNPDDAINNAVAGSEVGHTVWLGFRAPYAHKIEPAYAMMRLAAQRWKRIVDDAARIVAGRR